KINGSGAGTDDEAKLYINPTAFGADAAPTTSTSSSPILSAPVVGTDLLNGTPSVAGFLLRQGSASVPNVQVDELRVDRSWAQVTPPPGTSWNFGGDGGWSESFKWSGGVTPSDPAAFVNFDGSAISQPAHVSVDV